MEESEDTKLVVIMYEMIDLLRKSQLSFCRAHPAQGDGRPPDEPQWQAYQRRNYAYEGQGDPFGWAHQKVVRP